MDMALLALAGIMPPKPFAGLPEIDTPIGVRDGRSVHDGYQRGAALEFWGYDRALMRDPLFRHAFSEVRSNQAIRSLVCRNRLMNLYLIIRYNLAKLDSQNVIEFGSFRGGSAIFMAMLLREFYPNAKVYALDTFAGMPDVDASIDLHRKADFLDTNVGTIEREARKLGLDNLVLVPGLIEETGQAVYEEVGSFGLAHLDLDIYDALSVAQNGVIGHMAPGGYLVYDDATVASCLGATEAVEDLIRSGLRAEQVFPHFVFRAGLV